MTFRRRIALAGTAAVAVSILLALGIAFAVVRAELRGQVDDTLERVAGRVTGDMLLARGLAGPEQGLGSPAIEPLIRERLAAPDSPLSAPRRYIQLVSSDEVIPPAGAPAQLPVDERARKIAVMGEGAYFSDVQIDGVHTRVLTRAIEPGLALQAAQSVEEEDDAIGQLALILGAVGLGGVGLAAGSASWSRARPRGRCAS